MSAHVEKRPRCLLCARIASAELVVVRYRTLDGVPYSACADCQRARDVQGYKDERASERKGP